MDNTCLAAASTDPGQRAHNEDSFHVDEDAGLFVVADGVGGRDAGEIASRMACETIADSLNRGAPLTEAIQAAHAVVRRAVDERNDPKAAGMASTVVALLVKSDGYTLAWAGDSRTYLWSEGQLIGLTRDHSLVEQLIAQGELSRNDARDHPRKNVILSGVGGDRDGIQIGSNAGDRSRNGVFLLCSDGLTDVLNHATICEILARDTTLAERATELTDTARDAGGRDNITAILVECPAAPSTAIDAHFAPEVYELYEASSDLLTWPADQRSAPTIQRIRARSSQTGADTVTQAPLIVPADPDEQHWTQKLLIGAGLAILLAIVFLLYSGTGL